QRKTQQSATFHACHAGMVALCRLVRTSWRARSLAAACPSGFRKDMLRLNSLHRLRAVCGSLGATGSTFPGATIYVVCFPSLLADSLTAYRTRSSRTGTPAAHLMYMNESVTSCPGKESLPLGS